MRKVFLDDLPRWGKGGRINWTKSEGERVKFEYEELVGEIEIVKNNPGGLLDVKYNGKVTNIDACSFRSGKIGRVLGKITIEFKAEIGEHFCDKKRDLTVIDREYRHESDSRKNVKWYRCLCCVCGYEYWVVESSLIVQKNGCPCCTNQVVVEKVNDIPTTNPEMVKCFQGGYDEAKLYTKKSKKKIKTKCFFCKKEMIIPIYRIKDDQLSCKDCKGIKISQTLNKCALEDSFAKNDIYNKLQYWDYSKNKVLPIKVFKNSIRKFWFVCERKHSFKMSLSDIHGKRNYWCPHCSNIQKESRMATTLKQIFKYEFKNTIWEYDIGFRGNNGGISCYDIFIPEINLLIECQSEYHDKKIELDLNKKEFALKNGYYFFDIDYRNQSILSSVKKFFPYIRSIPSYVDYTKETLCNWNLSEAQHLLSNTELTQKEVCEKVGAEWGSFISKVQSNTLIIPDDKRKEKAVVQLNSKGEFVRRYSKATEFKKYGFNTPDISSCCKGKQHTHRGYIFMYEKDYHGVKSENGNIELKKDYDKIISNVSKKEILQINLKGEIVNEYSSLCEAERDTGFLVSNISACCSGVSKTSNGFIWVDKKNYNSAQFDVKCVLESAKSKMFKKRVVRIDLESNFKHTIYESAREAEKITGLDYRAISYKCRKKHNKKDKHIWMFEEDFEVIKNNEEFLIDRADGVKIKKYNS